MYFKTFVVAILKVLLLADNSKKALKDSERLQMMQAYNLDHANLFDCVFWAWNEVWFRILLNFDKKQSRVEGQ